MIHKSSIIALIGMAVCMISIPLPWATIVFERIEIPGGYPPRVYTLDLPSLNIPASGFETMIYPTYFALFLVILGVAMFTADEKRHIGRGLFICGGGGVLLSSYLYAASATLLARDAVYEVYIAFMKFIEIIPDYTRYWPHVSINFGCYLAVIGALIVLVSGFLALRETPLKRNNTPSGT